MLVKKWMSKPVIVAVAEDRAQKAHGVMSAARVHHMPVIDDEGRLIGILSDRDLHLPRWAGPVTDDACTDAIPEDLLVGKVMSEIVLTVAPDDHITTAAELMVETHLNAVPVVDERGSIEGLLSLADVVKALVNHVSQPPPLPNDGP